MSFRQPRRRTSPSHQRVLAPSAYSQGFASSNAPNTLHQPAPSAQISQFVPGGGATQKTPPSSYTMVVRDQRDFSLALSIQAAEGDTRECPWYGVWSKVLERYIFREADGTQTACTCIPQYSLFAPHDSGRSPQSGGSSLSDVAMGSPSPERHLMTPGSPLPGPPSFPYNTTPDFSPRSQAIFGGPPPPLTPSPFYSTAPRHVPQPESPTTQHVARLQARHAKGAVSDLPVHNRPFSQPSSSYEIPSDGILPTTPPRPTTSSSDASCRIPDFVQVLEYAQQPFPVVPGRVIRRVIMIVEIKPEARPGTRFWWESVWGDQVQEQALHAFEADRTLKYLGVIIAAGRRWVYGIVHRGPLVPRTMSEKRDPTFPSTGPPAPWSGDSMVEEWPKKPILPSLERADFLPKAKDGKSMFYEFNLLDAGGESLKAFKDILDDLRRHNSDIWV